MKAVAQTFWKMTLWFCLGGGLLFLLLGVLLAATIHTLDIYIHDKYTVITPTPLLTVSVILLAVACAVWKIRFST